MRSGRQFGTLQLQTILPALDPYKFISAEVLDCGCMAVHVERSEGVSKSRTGNRRCRAPHLAAAAATQTYLSESNFDGVLILSLWLEKN